MQTDIEIDHTNKVFFSVIINCHNGSEYLGEALKSVYQQTFSDWEIIFFNNNSSDNSKDIAFEYKDIRYFECNKTLSLGKARNQAASHARGEYIAFLDCDDLWASDKLYRQREEIKKYDQTLPIGLCYTNALRIDKKGNPIGFYDQERYLKYKNIKLNLMYDCFISMSSCVVSREAFKLVRGFNDNLSFVEDLDLWIKITDKYETIIVPENLTKIRFHDNNISRNYKSHLKETIELLKNIKVLPIEEKNKESIINYWKIRYFLIKLIAEFNIFSLNYIIFAFKVFLKIIVQYKMSFMILRKYFSYRLIKLFYLKYLKKK